MSIPRKHPPARPLFSQEDADLAAMAWNPHPKGYAMRWINGRKAYAHRVVIERMVKRELRKGELTDHINRDKNDNRRYNLRVGNKSLNVLNSERKVKVAVSGHPGIYLDRRRGKWSARVQRHNKTRYLGYFVTLDAAQLARRQFIADYDLGLVGAS